MRRGPLVFGALALAVAGAAAWWWAESEAPPDRRFEANVCTDSDPCTIDRWHRFQGRCIHAPDALCTGGKECEQDSDCAWSADFASCMVATCHSGECRYMKIGREECTVCGPDAPCEGTHCDPRDCRAGFCRHAPRDCDDGDPTTRDRCDDRLRRCVHELSPDLRPCTGDAECANDPAACERFRCVDRLCRVTLATAECAAQPEQLVRRCDRNQDCISSRPDGACWAGPCEQGFCRFRNVLHSQCQPCEGDHDCDGSFCEWPICTGTVCVTEAVPFCVDDNPLTEDRCSEERRGCLHRYRLQPSACARPATDDSDPTTLDVCHTETGATVHLPAGGGRCETTDRCWDTYESPDGRGCLGVELHCHHDDACPAQCDPAQGCVLDEDRDCHCERHSDCELGNPCARVYCLRADGGACWGTFIDNCIPCQADADCRVDDWCVFGECSEAGYCVYRDGLTCDDDDPATFGFCHGQRDDACTYEPIYQYE